MKFKKKLVVFIHATLLAMAAPAMADRGPSTSTDPYLQPMIPGLQITSILTTGDVVGAYKMGGIPDGLGAYDNRDGTFTVLMNHEIFADSSGPLGIVRAHGAKGAYVSSWVIDKTTLEVKSGEDLMKRVYQQVNGIWAPVTATGTPGTTTAFSRFCSADLAPRSAFYSRGKGTQNRIFLNGEESGPVYQRGLAHVATGPDKGSTYVLPWAASANGAWENLLASPNSGGKTVVIANADGGTNGVYVYVGTKTDTGNDVERAGLVGGVLYRVSVKGNLAETRAADAGLGLAPNGRGNYAGSFTLVPGADVANTASTRFQRPEDGAWDKKDPNRYYFVTTDQMDAAKDGNLNPDISSGQVGRSRLWALTFKDIGRPELGGSIEMLLDGTLASGEYQMFDNIGANDDGSVILQEDVGNNKHNGKVWKFNPVTGDLVKLARFDPALFGDIAGNGLITKDEESSGVIDVTRILNRKDGRSYSLLVAQNHAVSGDPETLEGGQLLVMSQPTPGRGDDDEHDED